MALNPSKLHFMVQQLSEAAHNNISSVAGQVFNYLDAEVKDNPVFNKYEAERVKWEHWPNDDNNSFGRGRWSVPNNFDDNKSLAYAIYSSIAKEVYASLNSGPVESRESRTFTT